jgi:hypothetical protein
MNTPNYYKGKYYKYEAHKVIEDFAGDNYNIGVALAYLMRAGKKDNNSIVQDLQKTIHHLQFELKRQKHLKEEQKTNKIFEYNGTSTY